MSSNVITRFGESGVSTVQAGGSGYTFATVSLAGTNIYTDASTTSLISGSTLTTWNSATAGEISPVISPPVGHGFDAVSELGGHFVILNTKFEQEEGNDITVANDFRQVGIVKNPTQYNSSTLFSSATARQTFATYIPSPSGDYEIDEKITQTTTGAVNRVVEWDATNNILYFLQQRFSDYGVDSSGNSVAFSGANVITGANSSVTGTPSSTASETVDSIAFTSGYANPELHPDSGEIIYIENRRPISRASDQTEDIKIIVEFLRMAQKTNLNVTPYYDDFEEGDNFHKVLYRPGFAVQARELTSQQSILQNQIEKMGRNIFKEGAVISGGEVGLDKKYYAVKVQGTFNTTDITSNISSYVNKVITGASSGVSALVVGTADAAGDDPITLFVKYLNPDNTGDVTTFTDGENLSANGVVGSFVDGQESLTVDTSNATATGSAVTVASGTYFVRGYFVNVSEQTLVLDKYSNTPSYRVGFTVTEDLVTPEEDGTLFDNATGTSNENAAGAHRLKITLTLSKLGLTETNDTNFVELMRINLGNTLSAARPTEYAVLGDTLARRTYDESGHYVVRDFRPDIRESLNDGVNNGVFDAGSITDDGATTSDDLLAIHLTPGKAYVAGYEVEKIIQLLLIYLNQEPLKMLIQQ